MKMKESVGRFLFKADTIVAIIMTTLLIIGIFCGTFDTMVESEFISAIVPFLKCVAIGVFILSAMIQFMSIGFKLSALQKKSALREIASVAIAITLFVISIVLLKNQALATATAITIVITNLVIFQGLRFQA